MTSLCNCGHYGHSREGHKCDSCNCENLVTNQLQSLLAVCYHNSERARVKAQADAICDEIASELFGKSYGGLKPLECSRVIERAVYRFDSRLIDVADYERKRELEGQ